MTKHSHTTCAQFVVHKLQDCDACCESITSSGQVKASPNASNVPTLLYNACRCFVMEDDAP